MRKPGAPSRTVDAGHHLRMWPRSRKVLATLPAVLSARGRRQGEPWTLHRPLSPRVQRAHVSRVTVRRVLTTARGFPICRRPPRFPAASTRPPLLLARADLRYSQGGAFHYSDTGCILLGELVRRVSGEPLDQFSAPALLRPAGDEGRRLSGPTEWKPRIAPTEILGSGMLRGVVHDGNAQLWAGGGGTCGSSSPPPMTVATLLPDAPPGRGAERQALSEGRQHPGRARPAPEIGETTRGARLRDVTLRFTYSRALGLILPPGLGGAYRLHRHLHLDGSGQPESARASTSPPTAFIRMARAMW